MPDRPIICVGVCTIKRPGMLANCLQSIADMDCPEAVELHLIVVDNDAMPSAKDQVESFAKTCHFPVHYHHEPRRGISMARNRAVEEALALGADRLAFVDDDQRVTNRYLTGHLEAAARHNADAVQPHIIPIFPEPAPFWCLKNYSPQKLSEGASIRSAGTCGVMFSTRLIRKDGFNLRFDEALALCGGEDGEFFGAAHKLGAKIVWSKLPVITEEVSRSRLTFSRYVMRGLSQGMANFGKYRRRNGFQKAVTKYLGVSIVRMFKGAGQLLISPIFVPFDLLQFKFTALEGGRNIFVAAGAFGAMLSLDYGYYNRIDGY